MTTAFGITVVRAVRQQLARAIGGAIVVMMVGAVRNRHGHSEDTGQMAVRCLVGMAMDPTTVAV